MSRGKPSLGRESWHCETIRAWPLWPLEDLLFTDLKAFNDELFDWLLGYNTKRPYHALGLKTPASGCGIISSTNTVQNVLAEYIDLHRQTELPYHDPAPSPWDPLSVGQWLPVKPRRYWGLAAVAAIMVLVILALLWGLTAVLG